MSGRIIIIILPILVPVWVLYSCEYVNHAREASTSFNTGFQKDTCNNPDADINCSFIHMPSVINNIMNIASDKEPGDRVIIKGTVFQQDGKTPYQDVILYAYHTDNNGYYSKSGKEKGSQKWHGRLHGWCKTNQNGKYEIRSIRPAPYPNNRIPAHIHIVIKEPVNNKAYYISDIVFKDDKMLNENYLKSISSMPGGSGVVDLKKSNQGIWKGERNIVLKK